MSLTSCLRKAGDYLSPEDRNAVLDLARANRAAGMGATEAAAKAIDDQLAVVEGLLAEASPVKASPNRQTETPEFKEWFGDSKVVGHDGKPMIVYHGTNTDITAFDIAGADEVGSWFTAPASGLKGLDPGLARRAADGFAGSQTDLYGGADVVMPVYLSIKKPKEFGSYKAFNTWSRSSADGARLREKLISQGFDGMVIRGSTTDTGEFRDDWVAFEAEQIKSAIGNSGAFDATNPDIRASTQRDGTWDAGGPTKMDDFLRVMQDKHIDTKRVVAAIKSKVSDLKEQWDTYLQEELYHGRSAKKTKDFLDFELRPLLQDMQGRGVSMDELQTYLHNRHAEERNNQIAKINDKMPDGGSGIKTADAKAYLSALDPAKQRAFEALAKRVDAIVGSTDTLLVASGLEKQETIDAWQGAYKHYVPLNRTEFEEDPNRGTGQGVSVKGGSSRRAMGSEKEVGNILANVASARERAIVRAEKNRVASALYGLAIKAPNKDFWMPFAPDRMKNQAGIEGELINMGLSPEEAADVMAEPKKRRTDPNTGKVSYAVNPLLRNADNVVSLRVNGEDRFVLFNHKDDRANAMVRALKNLDADQLGRVLSISAKISRYFASVNTQYSPIFGVVNLLRDTQGVLLNLSTTEIADKKVEVLRNAGSALLGIYSDIRAHRKGQQPKSQWAQLYEEFQKEGGQTGYRDQYANPKERSTALEKELKQITEGKAKAAGRAIFDWLSDYNETAENATRLAAYKAAKDKGLSNARAASIAKNITVNFNRKGDIAQQAGALYAFFNASVQGTARMAETLKGPAGKKIIVGGLLLGTLQALLLSASGMGDDEPPEFIKDRNLVLPIGDGKYLTMPLPLGMHILPAVGRHVTEWMMSSGRNTGQHLIAMTGLIADAFNPVGGSGASLQTIAPTPVDWLAALAENKDFAGRQIYNEDRSSLSPTPGFSRAKAAATGFSKAISYYLNLLSGGSEYKPGAISPTPDAIDYLLGQVGGGPAREIGKAASTYAAAKSGEDLPPYKVPLLGRFLGDTTGQAAVAAKFYRALKEVNLHEEELKGRRAHGEGGTVAEYMRENPTAQLVGLANSVDRELAKAKALKKKLIEREAPKESILLAEARITAAMKRFNSRFDQVSAQQ
jgi:hypothetical protein